MWTFLARRAGFTPNLERRVSQLEHWKDAHELLAQQKAFSIEADIDALVNTMSSLREELHEDRKVRIELGTLNTEAILQGFKESAEGIVTQVIERIWSRIAVNRADIDSLRNRVNVLELRGEDGK